MKTAYSYVRISSTKQKLGAGIKRQIEAAEAYCKEHKLKLDKTITLSDSGVSAFKGTNVIRGKLGAFLQMVETGKVKNGSVLIVESLDRISRQQILDAQELFLRIINLGISIVTLIDRQEYSRETITKDPSKLYLSIGAMIRANDESETKSKRVKDARRRRQEEAKEGKAFKPYCPYWCGFINGKYIVNTAHQTIINSIFDSYIDGYGSMAIAKKLNDKGIESFAGRKSKNWYKKQIQNLLTDTRLIGNAPFLENKPDYFPKVIDPDKFHRVQFLLKQRTNLGGQNKKGPINVFSGLFKCSQCKGAVNKTRCVNSQGYEYFYLVCENARNGSGCEYKSILLSTIEYSFMFLMRHRHWFEAGLTPSQTMDIEMNIEALEGERIKVESHIKKLMDYLMESDNPPKSILGQLQTLEKQQGDIEKALVVQKGKLKEHVSDKEFHSTFFEELPKQLQEESFRIKVRTLLRSMIESIDLHMDSEFIHYVVNRKSGSNWSVVFTNHKPKKLQFQIHKGIVRKPTDSPKDKFDISNDLDRDKLGNII